ncbi:hypothetical protein FQN57_005900 [Myotisia sp. PD_48]|nr:hypothetical protein FQN57_005900 [Myotisia sp. PD_48]
MASGPSCNNDASGLEDQSATELTLPKIAKVRNASLEHQEDSAKPLNIVGVGESSKYLQQEKDNDKQEEHKEVEEPREELDEFGLPIRSRKQIPRSRSISNMGIATEQLDQKAPSSSTDPPKSIQRSASVPLDMMLKTKTEPAAGQQKSDTKNEIKVLNIKESPSNSLGADDANKAEHIDNNPPRESRHVHTASKDHEVSEWSHQQLISKPNSNDDDADEGWKNMPALGAFDEYDDFGRMVARGSKEDDENAVYHGLGGAGKGYTRVQIDEDAQSATSLDENTSYLFKDATSNALGVEDDDLRDPTSQLEATKDILTEGQRIAYVGVTKLTIYNMIKTFESYSRTKATKKSVGAAIDSMTKWGQQIMLRLYSHMEIDTAEQVMIEQLADHGVQPEDLVPTLMKKTQVRNPLASRSGSVSQTSLHSQQIKKDRNSYVEPLDRPSDTSTPPPPYEENDDIPEVQTPTDLSSKNLDIDLRWTVLCDLFLVLIADATYDSRSRKLLELVGEHLNVSWMQMCKFEKRIIDALEMQQEANKEKWDEAEHLEERRKASLRRRYMIMGLATVGGGLVIGLSAGLLAPVIGAGLAAGFTTIGVGGTGAFLGGVGGTALITSGATITGSTIGIRASHRRTSAVKTFEYRPLHNNKRLNLIVTISGWMNGKVDDVRLPFSTVDPIMGDIYSVLWEPEMLQSTGATINILATEALTQGLQQVLGATILTALMASLQLPIVLTKLSYLIDNPWNVSLVRAKAAGLILADSLIDRNLGNRPITLLGFSLGSRVIFSCLKELANKNAFGIVQNVYLFGSPIVANKDEYIKARSVVSGRFVNGYASNDWILGYLFRATSGGIMRVAGLAPVENVPGIENLNVTEFVNGHMAYRAAMPRLMREVGWEVESDEFTEIEDPDPENHQERQRELIREIHEARKQAEAKPDKKKFGFFKRGKLAEKKGWETYDPDNTKQDSRQSSDGHSEADNSVLFDIDAIRAELAGEQIEVKQLESTLPPIKVELNSTAASSPQTDSSPVSSQTKEPAVTVPESKSTPEIVPSPDNRGSPNGDHHTQEPKEDVDYNLQYGYNPDSSWPEPEDEIQMSFDTSYHTPATSQDKFEKQLPPLPDFNKNDVRYENSETGPQMSFDTSYNNSPAFSPDRSETYLRQPSYISPYNEPNRQYSNISLSHNAWADNEQYDDHNDSNIKMSFQ